MHSVFYEKNLRICYSSIKFNDGINSSLFRHLQNLQSIVAPARLPVVSIACRTRKFIPQILNIAKQILSHLTFQWCHKSASSTSCSIVSNNSAVSSSIPAGCAGKSKLNSIGFSTKSIPLGVNRTAAKRGG